MSGILQFVVSNPPPSMRGEPSKARLERMFNDHHDFIWRLLRRLGLNTGSADDAAQHVFLVAAERVDDIKLGSERSFLFGTALRVARSQNRSDRRWVLEEDMDFRRSEAGRPEELVDHQRAVELMSRILAGMTLDLRTVFILTELEGMTVPEVAALVEIPVGTAASRLRRARETFRAAVTELESKLKSGLKTR
ncbi:MAG TPA: sigma-70 family RNA polymerase sigma factor [Polyangiaceae bacterium]|nr:sigma-70 family RNA polymerase sigma factor [Polyangiaceae bacterium]